VNTWSWIAWKPALAAPLLPPPLLPLPTGLPFWSSPTPLPEQAASSNTRPAAPLPDAEVVTSISSISCWARRN
jgi:hypothetical protein